MDHIGKNSTFTSGDHPGGGGGPEGAGVSHQWGYEYRSPFTFLDVVHIDEDTSIRATVIGVAFYDGREMVLVSYMHNGGLQDNWLDVARLTNADAR